MVIISMVAALACGRDLPYRGRPGVWPSRTQGVTCGGTDRTLDEKGAFWVQYYTMLWLGTHWPGATQAEKDFALNRAASLRTVFCEVCR